MILKYCGHKKKEWKFQLPSAPHFERTWERLGKCKKKMLKTILKHRTVFNVALRTALVEAGGILNSRPIIQVSNDAEDTEESTPSHFLLLRANPSYKDAEAGDGEIRTRQLLL